MDISHNSNFTARANRTVCVLIPAYQEADSIGETVRRAREFIPDVFVVDDGSTDRTADNAAAAGAVVLRHDRNLGKGASLNTGFQHVRAQGFHLVITLDADGQHDPADIPRFVDAHVRTGIPVLVGNRFAHSAKIPFLRRWINRFMSHLLCRQMGQYLPDTQCGFRLYRCDVIPFVSAQAKRYAAESEILLHVAARNIRLDSLPITVIQKHGKSRSHPVQDAFRFFLMLARFRSRGHWRQTANAQYPDAVIE